MLSVRGGGFPWCLSKRSEAVLGVWQETVWNFGHFLLWDQLLHYFILRDSPTHTGGETACDHDEHNHMGLGILWKSGLRCHLTQSTNASRNTTWNSIKRKSYINSVQKCHRVLWVRANVRWTETVKRCSVVSWFLLKKDIVYCADCNQQMVQKPASVPKPWVTFISVKVPSTQQIILGFRERSCRVNFNN